MSFQLRVKGFFCYFSYKSQDKFIRNFGTRYQLFFKCKNNISTIFWDFAQKIPIPARGLFLGIIPKQRESGTRISKIPIPKPPLVTLSKELQNEFSEQSKQLSEARQTIDQLRLGATINLHGLPPTPGAKIEGSLGNVGNRNV